MRRRTGAPANGAGSVSEDRGQQVAGTGAAAWRSSRKAHQASAAAVAGPATSSGPAATEARASSIQCPVGLVHPGVDVPETGAVGVEAVEAAEAVGLAGGDGRGLDLVGGDGGQGVDGGGVGQ